MSELTSRERQEIDRANQSGLPPVVFVHGLWLLSTSWDRWRELFEQNGYAAIAPGWPDDPETVEEARAKPSVFAKKPIANVTDHYLSAISELKLMPSVVGHSFGGLVAQRIAGSGVSTATVAIDPAPFRGVLPLPLSSLKSAAPVLGNPANAGRAVTLTYKQFMFGWTSNLSDAESRELYERFHVAAPGISLFQAATANLNPFTEAKVNTKNPARGPLLIISGEKDKTVPLSLTNAAFRRQKRNPGLTEITRIPNRGHSLTIDSGWREVAQTALDFISRNREPMRGPRATA